MATIYSDLLPIVRNRLIEPTAKFWSDAELYEMMFAGTRDLWRDIVDLKQEHYLTVDTTNVSLAANATQLTGVPTDVHKVYLIEPRDLSENGTNHGLIFQPGEYNSSIFQRARSLAAIDPINDIIFYAVTGQGAPNSAPIVLTAPKISSSVNLAFSYCPSLGTLTSASTIPIPGEANNAIIAWTVSFAKSKESGAPDPSWLLVYSSEKQHILQSLGLRGYQEPEYVEGIFTELW